MVKKINQKETTRNKIIYTIIFLTFLVEFLIIISFILAVFLIAGGVLTDEIATPLILSFIGATTYSLFNLPKQKNALLRVMKVKVKDIDTKDFIYKGGNTDDSI